MSTHEITPSEIAAAALALVDLPYCHQGRSEDQGLDCAGVLVAAFRRLGRELREEILNYRRLPPEAHIRRCLDLNFQLFERREPGAGDVVHIRFKRDTQARHLGIIVPGPVHDPADLQIVHAVRNKHAVLLELLRGVLTRADIVGIYQPH